MVALSVAFYARLSVGSRQIVEIFNILNEFMGNVFGKVPAYTTIGYWTQELGLSVYKESCSLFKDKRYALIVDESMMIGSEKLLLTLAMPATLMPVLQLRKKILLLLIFLLQRVGMEQALKMFWRRLLIRSDTNLNMLSVTMASLYVRQ
mgnify:CR=1 FL=1